MLRQVISEKTSAQVNAVLEQVVCDTKQGTGKNAYVAGYHIAGKTGTSEKVAQDAGGGKKEYIVSFIGYAPADDPQVVCLVLMDTPSNESGYYISGGQMAAPSSGASSAKCCRISACSRNTAKRRKNTSTALCRRSPAKRRRKR